MASSHPIVRQINWLIIIYCFIILNVLWLFLYFLGVAHPLIYGALILIVLAFTVSRIVPIHHHRGLRYIKKSQYEKALAEYRQGYAFFEKHKWLDKYRYFLFISSSSMSFVEVAMLNMAFCYGQLGDGAKAVELYEEILERFPDSKIAKSSLNMINSVRNMKTS